MKTGDHAGCSGYELGGKTTVNGHRALHLKCTVTDQENIGDVRLDPLDRSSTAKVLQKRDDLRLIFGKHVLASSFLAWGHCLANSNCCHFDCASSLPNFDHHESHQIPLH
ncbi:hypothetical protein [Sinorhizobium fredii]|uniref:hypothetical protein n=1 Tax=Rhizobium fredii TaxID=380 RepID=UPI0035112103